ncbi:ribonuclease E/G [Buchnera aphidicola (Periphyllus koelreuteriae)]|uniref:ribonuclease E/G n=1 Tax=Buchnera aphidicola TaxID=9 RepID=UPI0031B89776
MRRMLINVVKKNIEIAIVYNKDLYNFFVKNLDINKKNNIYIGKIKSIENSLNAVFIDYGENKYGFLPFKNIFNKNLKKNILIQILKEEHQNKCSLVTTFIKFFGLYSILILNKPDIKKISKKIVGKYRKNLKKILLKLKIPINMGIILRTSAKKKTINDIQLDCDFQIKNLKIIKKKKKIFPIKINNNKNIVLFIIRNIIIYNINEIIINNKLFFNKIKKLLFFFKEKKILKKIKIFKNNIKIFNFYKINFQILNIFKRKVFLSSGACFTIDYTEALTVIDINSCHSNKGKNLEETAFNTNFESIFEIIKQLRIRDLGGIIIIDFINMSNKKNIKKIENYFKKLSRNEFSKIKIGKISKFGLLEISRQKLYNNFLDIKKICNKCNKFY